MANSAVGKSAPQREKSTECSSESFGKMALFEVNQTEAFICVGITFINADRRQKGLTSFIVKAQAHQRVPETNVGISGRNIQIHCFLISLGRIS